LIEFSDIILAALLFLLIYFLWKTAEARESAQLLAAKACQNENMQFLDGSVALKSISLKRNSRKQIYLVRHFRFYFSNTGEDKREGIVSLVATRQVGLFMDLPEAPTYSDDSHKNTL